jgi:hypothetical protein
VSVSAKTANMVGTRITGFLDFVHHPVFQKLENTMFWNTRPVILSIIHHFQNPLSYKNQCITCQEYHKLNNLRKLCCPPRKCQYKLWLVLNLKCNINKLNYLFIHIFYFMEFLGFWTSSIIRYFRNYIFYCFLFYTTIIFL